MSLAAVQHCTHLLSRGLDVKQVGLLLPSAAYTRGVRTILRDSWAQHYRESAASACQTQRSRPGSRILPTPCPVLGHTQHTRFIPCPWIHSEVVAENSLCVVRRVNWCQCWLNWRPRQLLRDRVRHDRWSSTCGCTSCPLSPVGLAFAALSTNVN